MTSASASCPGLLAQRLAAAVAAAGSRPHLLPAAAAAAGDLGGGRGRPQQHACSTTQHKHTSIGPGCEDLEDSLFLMLVPTFSQMPLRTAYDF